VLNTPEGMEAPQLNLKPGQELSLHVALMKLTINTGPEEGREGNLIVEVEVVNSDLAGDLAMAWPDFDLKHVEEVEVVNSDLAEKLLGEAAAGGHLAMHLVAEKRGLVVEGVEGANYDSTGKNLGEAVGGHLAMAVPDFDLKYVEEMEEMEGVEVVNSDLAGWYVEEGVEGHLAMAGFDFDLKYVEEMEGVEGVSFDLAGKLVEEGAEGHLAKADPDLDLKCVKEVAGGRLAMLVVGEGVEVLTPSIDSQEERGDHLRWGKVAILVEVVGLDFDLIHVEEEAVGHLAKHFH
jgi:hypothetical protein